MSWTTERARGLARPPVPARPDVERPRDELQPLQRARRARRAVPVRRPRGHRDAHRGDRAHGVQLALLPARHRPRPALRLPRLRPVRARGGPPLQPLQAAHRPVREGDRARDPVGQGEHAALHPRRHRRGRSRARRRGRRRGDPQGIRRRSRLRLGGRPPARHAVDGDRHLRGARQGLHEAAPRRARGPARDVRRPGLRGVDRVPQGARRHRRRAAARPPQGRRALPRREGPDATTGATARSATSPRTPSTPRPASRASRCASSRAWSRRCTRPASR